MEFKDVLNLIALLASPLVAIMISQWLQDRKELRGRRFSIFLSLISTRRHVINEEQARAFNSIDVIFSHSSEVRKLWHEYLDLLGQPTRSEEWGKKKLELLKAMANEVGYKNTLDHLDLDRVYAPTGLNSLEQKQLEILEKLSTFLDSAKIISVEK